MSDDDNNGNVIGVEFGKKKNGEPAAPQSKASELFQALSDEYDENDEGVEALVLIHEEGEPTVMLGNVTVDSCAALLMMGQQALIAHIYGGDDDTVH